MATTTIEVPQRVADALEALGEPVAADGFALKALIQHHLYAACDELGELAERSPESEEELAGAAQQLRALARRLDALAAACEALA